MIQIYLQWYFIISPRQRVGRIWHNVSLIIVKTRTIFVSDIVYTSCNFDLIHACLRVISISSNRYSV